MKISRHFSQDGQSPYAGIDFDARVSEIKNPDGSTVFRQEGIAVPQAWSAVATDILAQKYFRKSGVPLTGPDGAPLLDKDGRPVLGGERDARQVFHRLAGAWTHWGDTHGYFDTPADARAFYDEICHMLAAQVAAPNSPQWFNTGLHWAYGLSGPAQGHYYVEPDTGVLTRATSAYERPQPSACQPYHALVSTPSGPVAIGDIVTKHLVGLEVYDGSQAGGGTTRVVAVKDNGEKVVFAIALKNGVCIEATGDHLVLATAERRTDTAWCRVDELRPGMRLQLSTRTAVIADSDDRAIDEAALAGWLQGDGFVGQYAHGTNRSLTLEFMTINKDELEFVLERVERVFPNVHYHVRHVDAKAAGLDVRRIRLYGEPLRPFVEKYELLRSTADLQVPSAIRAGGRQAQAAYLSSLFQADGTVTLRSRHCRTAEVSFDDDVRPARAGRAGAPAQPRDLCAHPSVGRSSRESPRPLHRSHRLCRGARAVPRADRVRLRGEARQARPRLLGSIPGQAAARAARRSHRRGGSHRRRSGLRHPDRERTVPVEQRDRPQLLHPVRGGRSGQRRRHHGSLDARGPHLQVRLGHGLQFLGAARRERAAVGRRQVVRPHVLPQDRRPRGGGDQVGRDDAPRREDGLSRSRSSRRDGVHALEGGGGAEGGRPRRGVAAGAPPAPGAW